MGKVHFSWSFIIGDNRFFNLCLYCGDCVRWVRDPVVLWYWGIVVMCAYNRILKGVVGFKCMK